MLLAQSCTERGNEQRASPRVSGWGPSVAPVAHGRPADYEQGDRPGEPEGVAGEYVAWPVRAADEETPLKWRWSENRLEDRVQCNRADGHEDEDEDAGMRAAIDEIEERYMRL
jgi:hypothetical protein